MLPEDGAATAVAACSINTRGNLLPYRLRCRIDKRQGGVSLDAEHIIDVIGVNMAVFGCFVQQFGQSLW